eukprot:5354216-Amphidinium_carterae.1
MWNDELLCYCCALHKLLAVPSTSCEESSMSRDRAECYHGERKNAWHPDSIGMTVWEACGTLAMLWDCFAIPWCLGA